MIEAALRELQGDVRAHVAALDRLASHLREDTPRDAGGQLDPDTATLLGATVQLATLGSLLADRLTDPDDDRLGIVAHVVRWAQAAALLADLATVRPLGVPR